MPSYNNSDRFKGKSTSASAKRAGKKISVLFPKQNFLPNKEFFKNFLIVVSGLGLIGFLLSPNLHLSTQTQYKEGEVCKSDLKAIQDFSFEDLTTTGIRQAQAEEAALSIYDFDSQLSSKITTNISKSFTAMRSLLAEKNLQEQEKVKKEFYGPPLPPFPNQDKLITVVEESDISFASRSVESSSDYAANNEDLTDNYLYSVFDEKFDFTVPREAFSFFRSISFPEAAEKIITDLISEILERGIIISKELLSKKDLNGFGRRDLVTGRETIIAKVDKIWSLDEARIFIDNTVYGMDLPSGEVQEAISKFLKSLLQPNLTFNRSATQDRILQTRESVEPVFFQIKKGEMIVREGQIINSQHLNILQQQQHLKNKINYLGPFFGISFLSFLILGMILVIVRKHFLNSLSLKDYLLLCSILILILVSSRLSLLIASALENVAQAAPFNAIESYYYALPVAASTMLAALLVNTPSALIMAFITSALTAFLTGNSIYCFFVFLLSSLAGLWGIISSGKRVTVFKAGSRASLAAFLAVIPVSLIKGSFFSLTYLFESLTALSSGLISAVLVLVLLPALETIFKVTTDIRLLEISSMDNPLLQELVLKAPGTYHHSIVVGTLAEMAARAIGANPLLARVSSYYHDIGKTLKPEYFIENQSNLSNKHEKLTPSMSSLIILSHVKEGVEMGHRNGLPQVVLDVIQQHHGTSLIVYFYKKAKDSEDPALQVVKEEDFRYKGPRPQGRETALVMLADAIEAASRVLEDCTPAGIRALVERIIKNFFADGQLDECDLKLSDLHLISESFMRVLYGMFHHRIEYPDLKEKSSLEIRLARSSGSSDH